VAEISGKNRSVAIATPLGEDKVVITSMQGSEHLGELFHFSVSLLSEDHEIEGDDLLGENVTIRLTDEDDEIRYFNGYVTSFTQNPSSERYAYYQIELSPWLWFLTRTSDCRIFQEMEVPDIITEVMNDHGLDKINNKLTGEYRIWEYCVQYRETDFNFISRLMEQEGIYYYFEHMDGEHYLVLADGPSCHEAMKNYPSVSYFQPEDGEREGRDHIWQWQLNRRVQSGKFETKSFDFKAPKKDLLTSESKPDSWKFKQSGFEVFDYLGDYTERGDGERYAKIRMEEIAQAYEIAQGSGDVRGMVCGAKFKLTGYTRADQNREYVITGVHHSVRVGGYESGGGVEGTGYENNFTVMDARTQYRSPQITAKPEIRGPQTAMVTGTGGDEITTDEHGRVKVKFHWDRYAEADDTSSCWIRVSQALAGNAWGGMILPRVGQEVIVEYLEGDPDRPIVTGRVYNGDNSPPYKLPENKTISTLKSNSSKGGGGFNEIRFEDKKGEEQIYVHAEHNQDIRVKNDRFETVVNDRHLTVENDKFEEVKNNRNEKVTADHYEEIGKDRHIVVKGQEAQMVEKDRSVTVKGDVAEEFKSNHSHSVSKDLYIKAANICLEATTNITIKVGSSSIALDMKGVKLQGTQFEAKGTATAKLESVKTDVKGSAMLVVQGGLVKIN